MGNIFAVVAVIEYSSVGQTSKDLPKTETDIWHLRLDTCNKEPLCGYRDRNRLLHVMCNAMGKTINKAYGPSPFHQGDNVIGYWKTWKKEGKCLRVKVSIYLGLFIFLIKSIETSMFFLSTYSLVYILIY